MIRVVLGAVILGTVLTPVCRLGHCRRCARRALRFLVMDYDIRVDVGARDDIGRDDMGRLLLLRHQVLLVRVDLTLREVLRVLVTTKLHIRLRRVTVHLVDLLLAKQLLRHQLI